MFRLLYTSVARAPITPRMLADILACARPHNELHGISGLLVSGGCRFLQTIEGEEAAVRSLFERISHDDRHQAITILTTETIAERAFPRWAMAYRSGDAASLATAVAGLTEPLGNTALRAQFMTFVDAHPG